MTEEPMDQQPDPVDDPDATAPDPPATDAVEDAETDPAAETQAGTEPKP